MELIQKIIEGLIMRFLLLLLICLGLHAEPIEVVVTASPGGPDDTVTRKIVEKIETNSNLKFVIFNKPGAAHTIGYSYVHDSIKPTIVMSTPEIVDHVVYSDLTELYNIGYFYNILFVSQKSGINSLDELAKKQEVSFGHGGIGSYSYLAMKKVCDKKLKCLDVPYKSAAEGMMAIMSNTIDAYAVVSYGSKQYLENDRIKPIHNIRIGNDKSWFKLYSKNLSKEDMDNIKNILKTTNINFYVDMGFEK